MLYAEYWGCPVLLLKSTVIEGMVVGRTEKGSFGKFPYHERPETVVPKSSSIFGRAFILTLVLIKSTRKGKMYPYRKLYVNGRRIDEHRYVMEQHLGRELVKGEIVHHKDGNTRNNDLGNLELVDKSEHMKRHVNYEHMVKIRKNVTEACGEKCGRAKLTTKEALEVRDLYLHSPLTIRQIGAAYGIGHPQVVRIGSKQDWKHI